MSTLRRSSHPALRLLYIFVALAFALASCAPASAPAPDSYAPAPRPAGGSSASAPQEAPSAGEAGEFDSGDSTAQAAERLVIQNANLVLVVPDPGQSLNEIAALAEEMGGYVVSANLYQTVSSNGVEAPRGTIRIRVLSEHLNEAVARIEAMSDRPPQRRTIESEDVTAEYTDLNSRLRNLENTEAQLTEIMETAYDTEEVLAVHSRLVEVREEIEIVKGRMQFLEESSALSAIDVDLLADEAVRPLSVGGWEPQGVARDAVQALINAFQFFGNAVIWIVIWLLPVLAVFFLVFILPPVLIIRAWRRRRGVRQPPASPPASAD